MSHRALEQRRVAQLDEVRGRKLRPEAGVGGHGDGVPASSQDAGEAGEGIHVAGRARRQQKRVEPAHPETAVAAV